MSGLKERITELLGIQRWYGRCLGRPDPMRRTAAARYWPTSKQILNHMLKNQDLQDTFEGIAHWWLLEHQIECAIEEVELALSYLVSQDFVSAHRRADGRTHYRLNRSMERKIRAFLGTKNRN
jgi:hypothetical protein